MDFTYAVRSLLKNPGFTLLAILVMALGIGANTAVFSVVNTVVLKPLAYRDPDRIVTLRNFWKKTGNPSSSVSAPDFRDWHDQSSSFEALAYYTYGSSGPAPVIVEGASEYADLAPDFAWNSCASRSAAAGRPLLQRRGTKTVEQRRRADQRRFLAAPLRWKNRRDWKKSAQLR